MKDQSKSYEILPAVFMSNDLFAIVFNKADVTMSWSITIGQFLGIAWVFQNPGTQTFEQKT